MRPRQARPRLLQAMFDAFSLPDLRRHHPLVIKANKFSAAAKAKIEAAGGKVEEIGYATKAS